MGVPEAIGLTLTLLALSAALSAASWARTAVRESQRLREEVRTAIENMRGAAPLRHAIAAPVGAPAPATISRPRVKVAPPERRAAPPSVDDDALEIPAVLVGAQWKEIIERFAPVLGTTPVELLRAAISAGLTGGHPITVEMLEMLDKMVQERDAAPPSEPGSSSTH